MAPGAPLRVVQLDGEFYLAAADVPALLRSLSEHWKGLAEGIPDGADGRTVARGLADLLADQADEVDFALLTQGWPS